MSNESLEKAARALCVFNEQLPWEEINEEGEQHYREMARAVIESLLPVSDAVVQAAVDADVAHQGMVSEREVITAALRHILGDA